MDNSEADFVPGAQFAAVIVVAVVYISRAIKLECYATYHRCKTFYVFYACHVFTFLAFFLTFLL